MYDPGLFDLTPTIYPPDNTLATHGPYHAIIVRPKDLEDLILTKHYAQRIPSITWAFGLFEDGALVGGLTIGKPASPPLCVGVAGPAYTEHVYELNRLIISHTLPKNILSWFVSAAMRYFRDKPVILVSFADEGAGHHGYIYQATNWWYTGKSTERTDKYMPGGKHPRHYTEEFAHLRKLRTSKHRYINIPCKTLRRKVAPIMRYPICPYPKGDNRRYVLGERIKDRVLDTRTGDIYDDGDIAA